MYAPAGAPSNAAESISFKVRDFLCLDINEKDKDIENDVDIVGIDIDIDIDTMEVDAEGAASLLSLTLNQSPSMETISQDVEGGVQIALSDDLGLEKAPDDWRRCSEKEEIRKNYVISTSDALNCVVNYLAAAQTAYSGMKMVSQDGRSIVLYTNIANGTVWAGHTAFLEMSLKNGDHCYIGQQPHTHASNTIGSAFYFKPAECPNVNGMLPCTVTFQFEMEESDGVLEYVRCPNGFSAENGDILNAIMRDFCTKFIRDKLEGHQSSDQSCDDSDGEPPSKRQRHLHDADKSRKQKAAARNKKHAIEEANKQGKVALKANELRANGVFVMVCGGVRYSSDTTVLRFSKWDKASMPRKEHLGCHHDLTEKGTGKKFSMSAKETTQISSFLPILDKVGADPSVTSTLQSLVTCMPIPHRAKAVAALALYCARTDVQFISDMIRLMLPSRNAQYLQAVNDAITAADQHLSSLV